MTTTAPFVQRHGLHTDNQRVALAGLVGPTRAI